MMHPAPQGTFPDTQVKPVEGFLLPFRLDIHGTVTLVADEAFDPLFLGFLHRKIAESHILDPPCHFHDIRSFHHPGDQLFFFLCLFFWLLFFFLRGFPGNFLFGCSGHFA